MTHSLRFHPPQKSIFIIILSPLPAELNANKKTFIANFYMKLSLLGYVKFVGLINQFQRIILWYKISFISWGKEKIFTSEMLPILCHVPCFSSMANSAQGLVHQGTFFLRPNKAPKAPILNFDFEYCGNI